MSKLSFTIKQIAKMSMQSVALPLIYKKHAKKPVEKGLVIFADAHNSALPFSMKKMYERMVEDGAYTVETHITDFAKMGAGEMFSWMKAFMARYAVAEYVFICDNFLPVASCNKRPETKVVQLWHSGGLLKKSGYDTAEDIPKNYKGNVYKNYDLFTVSAEPLVPVFTQTMNQPEGVVKATGVSRTDFYFVEAWNKANREKFYQKHPEAKGKKIVLWAPTFRGNAAAPTLEGYDEILALAQKTADTYFWLIKPHHHLENHGYKSNTDIPTEELLAVADIMITDYSSVLFDYMAYSKPFVFFAPDLDAFDKNRGFYVPYDSFPTTIAKTVAELESAISHELANRTATEIKACYDYHMAACDGGATERIVAELKNI